jgi:hypothetical protein
MTVGKPVSQLGAVPREWIQAHTTPIGVPDLATARRPNVSLLHLRTQHAARVDRPLPSCWDKGAMNVSCRMQPVDKAKWLAAGRLYGLC